MLENIHTAWGSGSTNVLAVLPTGAGKTIIFARIMADHDGPCVAIAHRQELVGQISVALALNSVCHRIVGPRAVIKAVVRAQFEATGRTYYDPAAPVAVAGVDTLVRRGYDGGDRVTLWVQDEAHHVLTRNKWGSAAALFPNARGLGVTATPTRADGAGLGRHADGVFDRLLVGPSMRALIGNGYLTDYRIFAPPSDLDLSVVPVSLATGDYSAPRLRTAVRESTIMGDLVEHYGRIGRGRLGVTFVTDVQTANDVADAFCAAGVPAAAVSHKTADVERGALLRRFRHRELLQLVNVDLFGEGFDLPAIEIVSFGRPTESYALFAQQFGRSLRPLAGKDRAVIIDHVGNVVRHGLPDANRRWSLDRRKRRREPDPDVIPVRTCPECTAAYERIHRVCPWCGFYAEPTSRSAPEFVDGDLLELDEVSLTKLRGGIEHVDMSDVDYRHHLLERHCPAPGILRNVRRHSERRDTVGRLRDAIALWGARQRSAGRSDSESYRRFYLRYGVDVLTAQTVAAVEAAALEERILRDV